MPSPIAFLIGNQNYEFEDNLNTPINDVKAIAHLLEVDYGYKTHLQENLTKSKLEAFFKNEMLQKLDSSNQVENSVLIYFAGHGVAFDDDTGPNGYLIPVDGKMKVRETGFSMADMLKFVELLPCQHLLLVLDCCFSGAVRWAAPFRGGLITPEKELGKQHYKYYTEKASWQVLTSTAHNQLALDRIGDQTENRNSPFATCFMDALKGNADIPADNVITTAELFTYLRKRLPEITGEREAYIVQYPGLYPLRKHNYGEYLFCMKGFNPDDLEELAYENPYMGLAAYESKHKDLFFGRKMAIKKLAEAVEQQNLTIVLGASGSGKSSLVQAGILPKYKTHSNLVIQPGRNPIFPTGVYDILLIDQFEQLVTQSDADEAQCFLQQLEKALDNQQKIIITMRIDLESQLVMSEGLKAYWSKGRFMIPSITLEEWREIIITPAYRVGRFIEPLSLVDKIVEEVIHYPGSLPLLSFTMQHLFEACESNAYRNITEMDYANVGGVISALQAKADSVFESLDIVGQHTMRCLILRMISLTGGQNAGRKVFEQELIFNQDAENKSVKIVIDKLLENRLIRVDKDANGQKYYEPVHDALVYSWGKVSHWVKKEDLPLQESLRLAVHKYATATHIDADVDDAPESNSWLWNANPQIEVLEKLLGNPTANWMNQQEMDFVLKSLKRRANIITRLTNERDAALKEARAANNSSLVLRTVRNDKTLAFRMADYNEKHNPKNNVVKSIFHDIRSDSTHYFYRNAVKINNLSKPDNIVVAFSPDGKTFLTGSGDKTAKLWSLDGQLITIFQGHKLGICAVAFSPDGKTILTGSSDKTAILWSLDGNIIATFCGHKAVVSAVTYSPDGKTIATASHDKTIKMWSLKEQFHLTFEGHQNNVTSVAFSPDGKTILTGSQDKTVKIWSLDGALIRTFAGHNLVTEVTQKARELQQKD